MVGQFQRVQAKTICSTFRKEQLNGALNNRREGVTAKHNALAPIAIEGVIFLETMGN
jgi:hypothetical protein